jgi:glycosyltransferase involved in cell wall biosynthesis
MSKSVCIISLSIFIAHDGRVLRQIDYLSKEYDLHVIGYGPIPQKYVGIPNITWHELPSKMLGFPLSSINFISRLIQAPFFPRSHPAFRVASQLHCDAFHVNNWDSLPFAALAAKQNHAKLVLDIHESVDALYWGWIAPIVRKIMRKYSDQIDASTTVVSQLADQNREFGLDPLVVLSVPEKAKFTTEFRDTEQKKIRLVYHGPATPGRTTDLMINALALSDPRFKLSLILTNPETKYAYYLRDLAERTAPGRVSFYPAVAPSEIVAAIAQYDIGLFPLPPKNYNYLITLPNKLFEFMAAGLAVCIGPSPSMSDIVDQYQCGVIASSFEPSDIAHVLNSTSAEQWNEMRKASLKAAEVLNAENEMGKVLDIYQSLLRE